MSRIKRARPSPALVISIVAMFAALGGGAFAATATTSKDAINKKGNLNKNVVKKKNIANGAVATKKIGDGKVTGSKLSPESVSAEKLGSMPETTGTPTTVAAGAIGSATVTCPADSKPISGGYNTNGNGATIIPIPYESRPTDTGWRASVFAAAGATQLTAYVKCLEG